MADAVTLARFWQLYESGYLPSVGSWVQVAPDSDLTTVLNAFNSLGEQQLEIFLIDQSGSTVVWHVPDPLATNKMRELLGEISQRKILYSDPSVDITDEVLSALNEAHRAGPG